MGIASQYVYNKDFKKSLSWVDLIADFLWGGIDKRFVRIL